MVNINMEFEEYRYLIKFRCKFHLRKLCFKPFIISESTED